jgi:peptide chain release factor 2
VTLFNYEAKLSKLRELEARMGETDFWDDQPKARRVVAELKSMKAQIDPLTDAITRFGDAKLGYEMAKEAGDKDLLKEADEQLFILQSKMDKVELQSLLSGKHDHRNCFITIAAGAGGTEAEDWCEMLFRMYLFYCEKMGWGIEEVDKSYGGEVGIDSVTLHITGPYAFGYLNCERGTHRLARVSPFNAQGKRQTSFASVEVTPRSRRPRSRFRRRTSTSWSSPAPPARAARTSTRSRPPCGSRTSPPASRW